MCTITYIRSENLTAKQIYPKYKTMSFLASLIIIIIWFSVAYYAEMHTINYKDCLEKFLLLPLIEKQSIPKIVNNQHNHNNGHNLGGFGNLLQEHINTATFDGVRVASNNYPQLIKIGSDAPHISVKSSNLYGSNLNINSTASKSIYSNNQHLHIHHHYLNLRRYNETVKTHQMPFRDLPPNAQYHSETKPVHNTDAPAISSNNVFHTIKHFGQIKSILQSSENRKDTTDKHVKTQIYQVATVDQHETIDDGTTYINPVVNQSNILTASKSDLTDNFTSDASPADNEHTAYSVPLN